MDSRYGVDNLPFGVFERDGVARCGVRYGDRVLDLAALLDEAVFASGSLNGFLAKGRRRWSEVRARLQDLLTTARHRDAVEAAAHDLGEVRLRLPIEIGDYVDFYSSEQHARNFGEMFRPGQPALPVNWRHLPVGYHGRSGTVVPSGTPIARPHGQRKPPGAELPEFGPSRWLDIEAEVGFVVGTGSRLGEPIPVDDFAEHVFGVCLVNDWSARDLQFWEYVPLGPFLGKSFATSMSPWIVPLDALAQARVAPPPRDPELLPYLRETEPWGLDLTMEVRLNGHPVSRPPAATLYWTGAQQLAHLTVNGASTRPGDLYASGTVSGPGPDQFGSLIELSWAGERPIPLPDGTTRTFLEDGDEITITATAPGPHHTRIGLGEVTGRIVPHMG